MLLAASNAGARSITAALVAAASVGAEPLPVLRAAGALGCGVGSATLASPACAPGQTRCQPEPGCPVEMTLMMN